MEKHRQLHEKEVGCLNRGEKIPRLTPLESWAGGRGKGVTSSKNPRSKKKCPKYGAAKSQEKLGLESLRLSPGILTVEAGSGRDLC